MKILILANNDVGLYNFRKELIYELLKSGHKVYISLPKGDKVKPLVNAGCEFIDTPIDRRGLNPATDLKLFLKYLKTIRQLKPDYVLTYTIKPNIYGGMACRFSKIKFLSTITGLGTAFQGGGLLRRVITTLYRTSMRGARAVLFENVANMSVFLDNKIISKDQAVLLNGAGVNLEDFKLTEMKDDGTVRFLFMGRVMKEKGIDELFYAAESLKNEYTNLEFDILGFFEDNYQAQVEALSQKGIINYHGFQSDVKRFIEKSHCVILPSYHEGMSNTLLEAASMGRPLITSEINGCKEAVIDNESGYLCRVKDKEDLLKKMKIFVDLPFERKVQMGIKAREHIESKFDRARVIEKVINLLG